MTGALRAVYKMALNIVRKWFVIVRINLGPIISRRIFPSIMVSVYFTESKQVAIF